MAAPCMPVVLRNIKINLECAGRNVTTSRNSPVAGRGLIIIIGILPGGIDYAWMAFLRLLAHAITSYLAL